MKNKAVTIAVLLGTNNMKMSCSHLGRNKPITLGLPQKNPYNIDENKNSKQK